MNTCTVITSLYSKKDMTQAGVIYLSTALSNAKILPDIIDLSGSLDYFDSPKELYSEYNSKNWLNPNSITHGVWMDKYLPSSIKTNNIVFFSSLFSPDVVFHSRYSHNIKQVNPIIITAIGGCAISSMNKEQIDFLSLFFDYILIGHDVSSLVQIVLNSKMKPPKQCVIEKRIEPPKFAPNYSLLPLSKLVTVYSGHGCYYGKCRFCDYPTRSYQKLVFRAPKDVAFDINQIYQLQPNIEDIVLTQDSYTKKYLIETTKEIKRYGGHIPFNLMMRAEHWISDELGEMLADSGCTDVFIGAEALYDDILKVLNKGVTVKDIFNAIKVLSKYVDVTIGMILFVPGISKTSLINQFNNVEKLLPYLNSIEPEVLTVVQGSEFALNPLKFGIKLYETQNLLNDSWCFGLSQDIPWTMSDTALMREWFHFSNRLKELCINHVKPDYWYAIEQLEKSTTDHTLKR